MNSKVANSTSIETGVNRPAKPWVKYNVDWVPTLNLGHTKRKADDMGKAVQEQAERAKVRRTKKLDEAKTIIEEKRHKN